MGSVRVAIVGAGNCAASLVQGVEYYKDADPASKVPGLMHVQFGDYHVGDVEFVAAFDVDAKKVGLDLSDAIGASENNTIKICDVPNKGVTVQRGHTLDGLGKYYRMTIEESAEAPVDVVQILKDKQVDVLICYLPVGSEDAGEVLRPVRHRRQGRLRQRPPGLHRRHQGVGGQVHRGRCPDRRRRHQVAGRRHHHAPCDGEAVRGPRCPSSARCSSTSAATWTSRTCWSATASSRRRSRRRRPSPRTSDRDMGEKNVHIGPSDYVAWLDDRKWAYVRRGPRLR